MKKKIILGIVVFAVLSGVTFYLVKSKKNIRDMNGQPQQSLEEILKERNNQAARHIETPLGKSFTEKKWDEFSKNFNPEKDFPELAEIIRACYITQCFKKFSQQEMDLVLGLVIDCFSKMKQQDFALAGMLITQFERLPSPKHDSKNYHALESWYQDDKTNPILKRMSVLKLGIQDADPESKWIGYISQGLTGKTFGLSRTSWIQWIGNMRNIPAQKRVLDAILKNFSKMEQDAQAESLVLLAQNSDLSRKQIKETYFRFLASDKPIFFQAALRSTIPLNDDHCFSANEILKIKDRLHSFPEQLSNPFVNLKSKELLNILK